MFVFPDKAGKVAVVLIAALVPVCLGMGHSSPLTYGHVGIRARPGGRAG